MSEGHVTRGGNCTVPEGAVGQWPHNTQPDREAMLETLDSPKLASQQQNLSQSLSKEGVDYMRLAYCIPLDSGTPAIGFSEPGGADEPR